MVSEENSNKSYESRPFYLWFVSSILASVFLPFAGFEITLTYILLCILIIYLIAIFSIRVFVFKNNEVYRFYPFRLFYRKVKFEYSKLIFAEIRNRKEPYQRPYVILHFNIKKIRSKFFSNRSFIYSNAKELETVLKLLVKARVKIYINMTSEFRDQYDLISALIRENGGERYMPPKDR